MAFALGSQVQAWHSASCAASASRIALEPKTPAAHAGTCGSAELPLLESTRTRRNAQGSERGCCERCFSHGAEQSARGECAVPCSQLLFRVFRGLVWLSQGGTLLSRRIFVAPWRPHEIRVQFSCVFLCFLHFHARVSDPSRAKQENFVEIREKPENIFWVSEISLFSQFLAFPGSREGGALRAPPPPPPPPPRRSKKLLAYPCTLPLYPSRPALRPAAGPPRAGGRDGRVEIPKSQNS